MKQRKIGKGGLVILGLSGLLIVALALPSESEVLESEMRAVFKLKLRCVEPRTQPCVEIFGLKISKGYLEDFEIEIGKFGAMSPDDCPTFIDDGHIWVPEQSWGATHLNICYDEQPEGIEIEAVGTENTEEFNDYDQWKAAAESATGQ